ncbi:uridylate-specific endoribonuclease-like isoform X1 [Penaeus chinensis]|uniref:uridylate-specific endoribonuclease-like isoform X1 n=1 Tax=Penaeus chinensis TaxID=139456 RepID=UPI001FB7CA97|nr:uridylate-specific endoribonuclease-like isoform X1 [Penaeus chinensis]
MKLVFCLAGGLLCLLPLLQGMQAGERRDISEGDADEEGLSEEVTSPGDDQLEKIWEQLDRQTVLIEDVRKRLIELETRLQVGDSRDEAQGAEFLGSAHNGATDGQSCVGRCGDPGNSSACGCNVACAANGTCCRDHRDVCLSCRGRCGEAYQNGRLCQCDSNCKSHRNCCNDVSFTCDGIKRGATTQDLREITEKLLAADVNGAGASLRIDLQGKGTSDDLAGRPLFKPVPASALASPTIRLLEELQNNYSPNVTTPEAEDPTETAEKEAFLNAVMQTEVMQLMENFLKERGFLTGSLKDRLDELWFTLYTRKNILSSSGFEHVFAGEVRGQKVLGLHNWVYFLQKEQEGDINYMRWLNFIDLGDKGEIVKVAYKWMDKMKKAGSMFVGTSPELDLAVYTLCILTRPNRGCPVQMNGHKFNIQTWVQKSDGKELVGAAFPAI